MDNRLDNIEKVILEIRDKVESVSIDTATNKVQLGEHMRRTDAVEKQNSLLIESMEMQRAALNRRIEPLETLSIQVKFLVAVLGVAGSAIGILAKMGLLHF